MGLCMEREHKRQRVFEPPDIELHHRREQNDLRLKSTFESIFEKYSKDFGGIGDEIDLETGEIIVDNGHILGMANERDAGGLETDWEEGESDDSSDDEGVLALSSLRATRRRIRAMVSKDLFQARTYKDEELQSADEADSLMGDDDSLVSDPGPEPAVKADSNTSKFLYDKREEEDGDDLANGEVEWPTPRKVWPKPKETTPFGHPTRRPLPLPPVYGFETSINGAWRAPPLLTDDVLWKRDKSVRLPKGHGTRNAQSDRSKSARLLRDFEAETSRWESSLIMSPLVQMGSLDRRKVKIVEEVSTQERGAKPLKYSRWTNAEENLLRRLRTTTNLMYSEIEAYFPGRKIGAIMMHWSLMTRKGTNRRSPNISQRTNGAVPYSTQRSSLNHEGDRSPANDNREKTISITTTPVTRVRSQDSSIPDRLPHLAISTQKFMSETPRPSDNLKTSPRNDPTEESSLAPSTSRESLLRQVDRHESCSDHIKEEGTGQEHVTSTEPFPDLEARAVKPLNNCDRRQKSSLRLAVNGEVLDSTSSNSSEIDRTSRCFSSTTPSIKQGSSSSSDQTSMSKKVALPSPHQSDISDDELSAPIKTVGLC